MSQQRNKAVEVVFDALAQGVEDALVISKNVGIFPTDMVQGERTNYTIWRPYPYINQVQDGISQTNNFKGSVQRATPAQVNKNKSVPFLFTETEMNDPATLKDLTVSAKNALASAIENDCIDLACTQGSLVVPVATALSGYDDVALCDSIMNEQEIPLGDRKLALNTRDYNLMAGNLAARQLDNNITSEAYREASLGRVSSFETFKMQSSYSLTAAAASTVTINGANQYYTPVSTDQNGNNVDTRYQILAITVESGTVKAGDCFTIADVYALGHQSKRNSGQLKTFRVHEIVTGAGGTGTIKISPPIISNGGGTAGEEQYQNVDSTPANGAALTFLNTATKQVNPFWSKDAIEILPGKMPKLGNDNYMTYTTKNGISIAMRSDYQIGELSYEVRFDIFYGTTMRNPEKAGILIGSQI